MDAPATVETTIRNYSLSKMTRGAKIATFVLLAAALIELCTATKDNIFNLEYENRIVPAKLRRRLFSGNYKLDIPEVARLLAKSQDKTMVIFEGVTIEQLLRVAEVDLHSARDCLRDRLEESKAICKRVGSHRELREYCTHCVDRHFNHCVALGGDQLFEQAIQAYKEVALNYSRQISDYIYNEGEEEDPETMSVRDFLEKKLDAGKRQEFKRACVGIEEEIRTNVSYFDEDARRTEAYLKENNEEGYTMRRRCKYVIGLVRN